MDKYIGRLLDDRYEILEVIGVGGMAVVYRAKCHRLNRMVAIKILKDDYLEDEDFRSRFHAEGQAVAMLSHPNIVSVYDVSTNSGGDYIVMELIEGITLKQYIERKGALSWKETLHFALQIAKALDHAHSRGIVHRDIKPHNIMVLRNGTVKVADFGIARGIAKGNTLRKEALGSVHYISPEQAKGEHVDARSDIYSLGVVMYEMATAKQPYEGTSPINVALQHINGTAVMPSVLNPEIPVGLEQIIMKAMEKDPENRYDSAMALAEAIEQFQNDPDTVFPYPMLQIAPRKSAQSEESRVVKMQPKNKSAEKKPVKLPEDSRRKTNANNRGGKNTNVARVAIIACTAAILIAIGILVLLLSGSLFGSGDKMVSVPNLNGKMFDTLPSYPGIKIEIGDEVYDNFYEVGTIISQDVAAESEVIKGTTIYVTVSKGPEPVIYKMKDVVGMYEAEAYTILSQMGIRLDIQPPEYVVTEAVKPGRVIRTAPEKDTVLQEGQTIILYVAKSKTVEKAQMIDVENLHVDDAIARLKLNKFENVKIEYVEDGTVAEGTVLKQSVDKGTKLDITKEIVLKVATAPAPTEPPTEPTQPDTNTEGNGQ
jgi:serine/threonine-protein kinase